MDSSIEQLKEMVRELPDLGDLIRRRNGAPPPMVEYNIDGMCLGFGLWKGDNAAVQRAYMSKGSVFSPHEHGSHEHDIVAAGKVKVCFG